MRFLIFLWAIVCYSSGLIGWFGCNSPTLREAMDDALVWQVPFAGKLAELNIQKHDYSPDTLFPIYEYAFPNGLRLIVAEHKNTDIVSVRFHYTVGSKDEQPQQQGAAHFLEHMMFNSLQDGSQKVSHSASIEHTLMSLGAQDINAETIYDTTSYHEDVVKEDLLKVLVLEKKRMRHVVFEEATFELERSVIQKELASDIASNLTYDVYEKIFQTVFAHHPYAKSSIGTSHSISALLKEDVKQFYDRYYHPQNLVISIAGNLPSESMDSIAYTLYMLFKNLPLHERVLSSIKPSLPSLVVEQTAGAPIDVVLPYGDLNVVFVVFRLPPSNNTDWPLLELLPELLNGADDAPLQLDLVKTHKAFSVDTEIFKGQLGSLFIIKAWVKKGKSLSDIPQKITHAVKKFLKESLAQPLWDRAKLRFITDFYKRLQTPFWIAKTFAELKADGLVISSYIDQPKVLEKMLLRDALDVFKKYLQPQQAWIFRGYQK